MATYIVLYAFRDKDDFNVVHKIGDDVSYMDADRLTDLVAKGLIKIEGYVAPPEPDPSKPAEIDQVANYSVMATKIAANPNAKTIYFVTEDEQNGGGFPAIYLAANNNTIRLIPQLTA